MRQAATAHGIVPRPDSVVVRTRFDVFFDRPYDLTGLRAYFLSGHRGRHLVLAQEVCNAAQSDVQFVTSWSCYAEDIALALHAGDSWGLDNGWGYGALQQPPGGHVPRGDVHRLCETPRVPMRGRKAIRLL